MTEQTVRVEHDDQPNEVADRFKAALEKLGMTVRVLDSAEGEPWIDYRITIPQLIYRGQIDD